jgi:hypothetical protein
MSKQLRDDLLHGLGTTMPDGRPAPARQNSKLPSEFIWALEIWGLPIDRVIRLADLRRSGLVKNPSHAARLRAAGTLPDPHWVSPNYCFWYGAEIARMILTLPTERPTPCPGRKKVEGSSSSSSAAPAAEKYPAKPAGRGPPRLSKPARSTRSKSNPKLAANNRGRNEPKFTLLAATTDRRVYAPKKDKEGDHG